MAKRMALGKGADALLRNINGTNTAIDEAVDKNIDDNTNKKAGELMVKISLVEPNRNQPRKMFDKDSLDELTKSVKQYGVLQPIIVKKIGNRYEIVAGERRWRAAQAAGLSEVPVVVRDYDDQKAKEIAIIENIQRTDLNPIEEALAYKSLIEEYNLTQEELSDKVSKNRSTITNSLRLLKLSKNIQQYMIDGQISSGHARALLSLEDEGKRELLALDIMKRIMKSAVETGTPFIFFRDTVNRLNANSHKGMIYSSNLCHEIAQNMSETRYLNENITENGDEAVISLNMTAGDMVTCNLNSINLGRTRFDELKYTIPLQIRMLDNVITLNQFPVPEADITSNKYRAIGLGVSGYHHYLAKNKIAWESEEHINEADRVFEEIAYNAIRASMLLAKEKGAYKEFAGSKWQTGEYFNERGYTDSKWQELKSDVMKYGIRNGYLMAVAPTGSTSNIANTTAGIDPIFKKFFVEEKKGSFTPKTAPELNNETFWYYKEAHTIEQLWSIRACAVRQRHIDQAQSFNLYITPQMKAVDILNLYIEAYKQGIKTIYYIRNMSLEMDECTSCSS